MSIFLLVPIVGVLGLVSVLAVVIAVGKVIKSKNAD